MQRSEETQVIINWIGSTPQLKQEFYTKRDLLLMTFGGDKEAVIKEIALILKGALKQNCRDPIAEAGGTSMSHNIFVKLLEVTLEKIDFREVATIIVNEKFEEELWNSILH